MSEPTRYLARQDGMLKHKDGTWIRFEEYAELQDESDRRFQALAKLATAVGNPALEIPDDSSIEETLIYFVIYRLKERDQLKSWQEGVLKEVGPEPILVYREFDWYYWASHRITNLAAKLVEASNAMVSLRSKLSDHVSLSDVDAFDAAIAKLQPAPTRGESVRDTRPGLVLDTGEFIPAEELNTPAPLPGKPSATLRDFGYAPGSYTMKCPDCQREVWDVDKRARRCKECAEQRLAESQKLSGEQCEWEFVVLSDGREAAKPGCKMFRHFYRDAASGSCPLCSLPIVVKQDSAQTKGEQ